MDSIIKQILREAIIAHREGKLLEADRLYKEVLNSQVNNPEANHNLGVLAVSVGKVEAALPYFKVALENNPKQTQFWLSYITALIKLEKFNLAEEALKNMKTMNLAVDWLDQLDSKLKRLNNRTQSSPLQGAKKNEIDDLTNLILNNQLDKAIDRGNSLVTRYPKDALIRNILGSLHVRLGASDQAIASYEKAIELKADYFEAFSNLGSLYRRLNNLSKAEENLKRAIEINPLFPQAHLNLANLLNQQKQIQKAKKHYIASVIVNPNYTEAYENLIDTLLSCQEWIGIKTLTRRVLKLNSKSFKAIFNLAQCHIRFQDYENVKILLRKAIKLNPDVHILYQQLGKALESTGEDAQSMSFFLKASKIEPGQPNTNTALGDAFAEIAKYDDAILYYKRSLIINPKHLSTYNGLAVCFKNVDCLELSQRYLIEATILAPKHSVSLSNLATVQNKLGDSKGAKNHFVRSILSKPDNELAYYNCGNILFQNDDFRCAINNYYNRVILLNPIGPDGYHNRGASYNKIGDRGQGLIDYKKACILNPQNVSTTYNVAQTYDELGYLNLSLSTYFKVLVLDPLFENIENNLAHLLVQLGTFSKYLERRASRGVMPESSCPLFNCYQLINAFIEKNVSGSQDLSKNIKIGISEEAFGQLHPKNQAFTKAFTSFVTALSSSFPRNNSSNDRDPVIHLGESHCLSFAHRCINTEHGKQFIKPKLIFGAKAWHFSKPGKNKYKSIFEFHVNSIKDGLTIFLSFGEIDCRSGEGIIPYFERNGGNLEDIIRDTVSGYFDYVTRLLKEKKSIIYFVSVPAPVIDRADDTGSEESTPLRVAVVKLFNQHLQQKINGTKYRYIDIYSETNDGTGRSNKSFHVDDAHLDYRILPFIEKQLMR